jgi:hypothetical protein
MEGELSRRINPALEGGKGGGIMFAWSVGRDLAAMILAAFLWICASQLLDILSALD